MGSVRRGFFQRFGGGADFRLSLLQRCTGQLSLGQAKAGNRECVTESQASVSQRRISGEAARARAQVG